MAKEFNIVDYVLMQLIEINKMKNCNFGDKVGDLDIFKKEVEEMINNHKFQIYNYIHKDDDYGVKKYLFINFIKPKFFSDELNKLIDENKKTNVVYNPPVIEPVIKRGRPLGSKNKQKDIKINIPVHQVNDQNFIDAIKDILWYKSGLLANQIINHLDHDDSITKLLYAKLHEYKDVHWKEVKIIGKYGKPLFKWYPIQERKGYFYDGQLRSITNLANHTGMNKVTLWKRIKSGMNHIEAINKPIDDKMVRNGKNS